MERFKKLVRIEGINEKNYKICKDYFYKYMWIYLDYWFEFINIYFISYF